MSNDNINKILAAASSALSKREEFKKLLEEASKIKEDLKKKDLNKEEVENILDKGYMIATRFTSVGKHSEALDLLAYMIVSSKEFEVDELLRKLVEKFYQICSNAIKEAKEWEQYDLAMLLSFLVSAIESLNIIAPPEDLRKEILDLETTSDINPKLLDAKRDLNTLLINPNLQGIDDFTKKYEELFKGKGLERELRILIEITKHLAR